MEEWIINTISDLIMESEEEKIILTTTEIKGRINESK